MHWRDECAECEEYLFITTASPFTTLGNIFRGMWSIRAFLILRGWCFFFFFGGTEWYHNPYYRAGVTVAVAAASSRMQQNFVNIV